jgi:hypothetical protein
MATNAPALTNGIGSKRGLFNTQVFKGTVNASQRAAALTNTAFSKFVSYLPDSLIAGTLLFGTVTMNYPILVLLLFELETIAVHRGLAAFSRYTFPAATEPSADGACKDGYHTDPTEGRRTLLALFGESGSAFPVRPLFLLSAVLSYLYSSLLSFQDVIRNLDKDYNTRVTFGGIGTVLAVLVVFAIYMKNGCMSFLQGAGTVIFGILLGAIGMLVHSTVFGRDSVNFLGLPLLGSAVESRAPLYVCAPTVAQGATA